LSATETIREGLAAATRQLQGGDLESAAETARGLLDVSPHLPEAMGLLGVIEGMRGRAAEARSLLERAVRLRPNNPELANNLALACIKLGDPESAERVLRDCLQRVPQFYPGWYTLGVALRKRGDVDGAIRSYERLLTIKPDHVDAWANLAQLRERLNQLEDARSAAERALALDPDNPMTRLVAAQIAARRGDHESAREGLAAMLASGGLSENHEVIARSRLGDALDHLGRPEVAFAEFEAANRLQAKTSDAAYLLAEGPYSLPTLRRVREAIDRLAGSHEPVDADSPPGPAFLMGFPRSGTTLLDRMLIAHPQIDSVEERETLVDAQRDFAEAPGGMERLAALSPAERAVYRDAHGRRLADAAGNPSPVLIDKLPLHTAFLPLIGSLMPDACVVFVVRDPRDVCLSCYMQRFSINTAMAHFLDLEMTAEYYAEVMAIGLESLEKLPVRHVRVRYEDLVEDPEPPLREICGLLGLSWDPAMLDYRSGLAGHRIDTPSYRQVSRPLYTSSIGRWRRYRDLIGPLLEKLQPFVERLGYD
jgi:tetratricopeptide (TPR) repeat protein